MATTANIEIVAGTSGLSAGLRAAGGMIQGFASSAGQQLRTGLGKPLRLAGLAADFVGIGVAMRGIEKLGVQGKNFLEFDDALTRFGIATRSTPEQLQAVARAARQTSTDVGLDAREVLAAGRAYVDLAGGANFSINKMRILASAAQASGSDTKDMAGMMYQLTRSMKVADSQMEDTIGGLINQAKDGAIEAAQMSREFAGMMPVFARFGITGREGAIQLGAMYQITRDGFDSAAEAATGMIRLMSGLQRHADKFAKAGVQVFKKGSKSELRDLQSIMADISKSALAQDTMAKIKAFGRSEAWRTQELQAESVQRMQELVKAGRENGVVQKDLATISESASGRMNRAFETAKNTISEAFTKERVDKFMTALEGVVRQVDAIAAGFGAVGDAISHVIDIGRAIRGFISSNVNSNPWRDQTDAEKRVKLAREEEQVIAHQPWRRRFPGMGKDRLRPGDELSAQHSQANRKAYDEAVKRITDKAGPYDKPTEESIRQAVMESRSNTNKIGGTGSSIAGDRYLRESGMSKAKVDEITKAMDAKATAEILAPHLDALGDRIAKIMQTAMAPSAHAKEIAGQSAARHLASAISVNFDGNEAKRSTANATDRRRRP